jgi:hypothetical protein
MRSCTPYPHPPKEALERRRVIALCRPRAPHAATPHPPRPLARRSRSECDVADAGKRHTKVNAFCVSLSRLLLYGGDGDL